MTNHLYRTFSPCLDAIGFTHKVEENKLAASQDNGKIYILQICDESQMIWGNIIDKFNQTHITISYEKLLCQ